MIAVKAIYEDGKVKLPAPFPLKGRHLLIVAVLDEPTQNTSNSKIDAFESLIGATAIRTDGAEKHDDYMCGEDKS